MATEEEVHEGSCCCGRVRFRVTGPFGTFSHCHCTDCRKSHGAAFASYIGVARARFTFLEGESEVAGFTAETGTRREFCRHCGSSLTGSVTSEPDNVYIAAGTFDTPLRLKPEYHIFIRSKVPWLDLHDGLPQHREFSE
ncbi:MAG: GFA family protein [Acidobacteria bacterium]|nr:MAG: GFA family protein [Acidobacteriota bacterium]